MRQTCLNAIHHCARQDPRVVFIGSDLGAGTLEAMRREMPERFFMEGVAEQHLIGMAAGMAMEGFIPFVNTIATFLTRRCLEQIAIDLCLHRLPVRLIGNGGGMVYAPLGPTHTATDDIALLRPLPHMTILAPADAEEMKHVVPATLEWPGPVYIRLAKGKDPVVTRHQPGSFHPGRAYPLRQGRHVALLATGITTHRALQAADELGNTGLACTVLHLPTLKPLDTAAVVAAAQDHGLLVTVEEHALTGGLGSAVAETLADARLPAPLLRLGLPDAFPHHYGSQEEHLAAHGLDAPGIVRAVRGAWRP